MSEQAMPRRGIMNQLIRATNSIRELLLLYAAMTVLAAAGFAYFEDKPFQDALWWAVVTTTTTGYGDIFPVTPAGRVIAGATMLVSILFVLPLLIGYIATSMIQNRDSFAHEEQEQMKAELAAIRAELARLAAARESQT